MGKAAKNRRRISSPAVPEMVGCLRYRLNLVAVDSTAAPNALLRPSWRREQRCPQPSLPSAASARNLDWFTFFLADIQTGFGPFVAISHRPCMDAVRYRLVLTAGGWLRLLVRCPAVCWWMRYARPASSAVRRCGDLPERALAIAIWPIFPVVLASRVLHASASCVIGPIVAAISLGLVGHAALGARLGLQCAVCLHRQWRCRCWDGPLRAACVQSGRLLPDCAARCAGSRRACPHSSP